MRHYCAAADRRFVAQLLALHSSMERWCKPFKLWVMCLDHNVESTLRRLGMDSIEPVPKSRVETQATRNLVKKRPHKQYIWTLKPLWISEMLRRCSESITYLDADSFFFYYPDEVYEEIKRVTIAITPHRFSKGFSGHEKIAGIFNAGFIYFKKGPASVSKCASTWVDQVIARCERRPNEGFFDDQMYLNEWPKRWGAYSIQHKGFNLAPWNQGDDHYRYTMREKYIYVDGDRLIWYHFHQGLKPSYNLVPFVKTHIYEPYRRALGKARKAAHS